MFLWLHTTEAYLNGSLGENTRTEKTPMKNKTQRGEAKKHTHKRSETIQTSGKKRMETHQNL